MSDLYTEALEVRSLQRAGLLPGLVGGAGRDFIISVVVPDHPHDHPRLVIPNA